MADEPDYTVQPAPAAVEGATSTHDLIVSDLEAWDYPDLTAPAIAAVRERKAYGLRKYERVLHKDNGRDHVQDAEDEAMDLAAYLRTWIDYEPGMRELVVPLYESALWTLVTLRNWRLRDATPRPPIPSHLARRTGPLTPHPESPLAPDNPEFTCPEHGQEIDLIDWNYRAPGPSWNSITYACKCVRRPA